MIKSKAHIARVKLEEKMAKQEMRAMPDYKVLRSMVGKKIARLTPDPRRECFVVKLDNGKTVDIAINKFND